MKYVGKSATGGEVYSKSANPYDDETDPQKYEEWEEGYKDGKANVRDAGGSAAYKEGNRAAGKR